MSPWFFGANWRRAGFPLFFGAELAQIPTPTKPPTPPDPDLFTIRARIESRLDGMDGRLERMEGSLDDLRGFYRRLEKELPSLSKAVEDAEVKLEMERKRQRRWGAIP